MTEKPEKRGRSEAQKRYDSEHPAISGRVDKSTFGIIERMRKEKGLTRGEFIAQVLQNQYLGYDEGFRVAEKAGISAVAQTYKAAYEEAIRSCPKFSLSMHIKCSRCKAENLFPLVLNAQVVQSSFNILIGHIEKYKIFLCPSCQQSEKYRGGYLDPVQRWSFGT